MTTSAPYQYAWSSRVAVYSPTSMGSTGNAMPMPRTSIKTTIRINGMLARRGALRSASGISRLRGGLHELSRSECDARDEGRREQENENESGTRSNYGCRLH